MPNENGSHDTPILDIWCQMVHNRAIKQTTTQGEKTEVKTKEAAEAIAAKVEQATGPDRGAFSNETGSAIIHKQSHKSPRRPASWTWNRSAVRSMVKPSAFR